MKQLFIISWSEGELTPALITKLIEDYFRGNFFQRGIVKVQEIPLNESEVTQEET